VDCSIPSAPPAEVEAPEQASSQSPLIFVYEMPPQFNTNILQRRQTGNSCVHRHYSIIDAKPALNNSAFLSSYSGWYYTSEMFLHEYFLRSPHRTLDPNKADFFYVPVYGSCNIQLLNEPSPRLTGGAKGFKRTNYTAALYHDAFLHVSRAMPFWNRTNGRDHIFTFAFDEGACFAPRAIRNAILLTRWGQTNSHWPVGRSFTSYIADQWDYEALVNKRTGLIGTVPCFDPKKDLVIPTWKPPLRIAATNFDPEAREAAKQLREKLFFFGGDLSSQEDIPESGPHHGPEYSRGIRQAVADVWRNNQDRLVTVLGHSEDKVYNLNMATHKFCGALPGDGWSGNFESAVFAGCIPVIINDGVLMPFENILNFSHFSVRVAEADVPNLVDILEAIDATRVSAMQDSLAAVRSRFVFQVPLLDHKGESPTSHDPLEPHKGHPDAFTTIMEFFRYKKSRANVEVPPISSHEPRAQLSSDHKEVHLFQRQVAQTRLRTSRVQERLLRRKRNAGV